MPSDKSQVRDNRLPKSQCEVEPTGKFCQHNSQVGSRKYPVVIVTLPEWLAINKELV